MSEPSDPSRGEGAVRSAGQAASVAGQVGDGATPGAAAPMAAPVPKPELTAEEQMARFEADLKENDWGHQPC